MSEIKTKALRFLDELSLLQAAGILTVIGLILGLVLRLIMGPAGTEEKLVLYKAEWQCAKQQPGSTGVTIGVTVFIPTECVEYRKILH